jgi:ribonuclease HII
VYNNGVNPSRKLEMNFPRNGSEFVVGLDEVGRGAWAGPMVAAAVAIPLSATIKGVRDSKLLSEGQREEAAHAIRLDAVAWSYGVVRHEEIDHFGLTEANRLVFERALNNLREPVGHALVDGKYKFQLPPPATFIVGGDRSEFLIAAASILAKVFRDRLMRMAQHLYPEFHFDRHKGYGTALHQKMICTYGITPMHRRSFVPRAVNSKHHGSTRLTMTLSS